ncbi:phosphoribosyltransferase [Candidatus Woesearchaeota archaeon]|nr:phosphoribosyltransferase [Candidatus Woesearchaeota archaeon]
MQKGSLVVPQGKNYVEDKTLFLFDDVSALGVCYPQMLVDLLQEFNKPFTILRAEELAADLVSILPTDKDIAVVSGGGVLTYLFLKRAGYQGELKDIIEIERKYEQGKPLCQLKSTPSFVPDLVLDDIIASGKTVDAFLKKKSSPKIEIACLVASTNVPKGARGERIRGGSTFGNVERLYCSQLVNGTLDQNKYNRKPAILSLRYLLTKAVDNDDYREGYLAKKFGGYESAKEIASLVKEINCTPISLLRKDPRIFLKRYGGI